MRSSLTWVLPLWGLISAAQITCTLKAHMKSAQVVRRLARHVSNAERVLGGAAVSPRQVLHYLDMRMALSPVCVWRLARHKIIHSVYISLKEEYVECCT